MGRARRARAPQDALNTGELPVVVSHRQSHQSRQTICRIPDRSCSEGGCAGQVARCISFRNHLKPPLLRERSETRKGSSNPASDQVLNIDEAPGTIMPSVFLGVQARVRGAASCQILWRLRSLRPATRPLGRGLRVRRAQEVFRRVPRCSRR